MRKIDTDERLQNLVCAAALVLLICLSVLAVHSAMEVPAKGLTSYVESETGLFLEDIVEKETGSLSRTEAGEYVAACLTLRQRSEEEVDRRMGSIGMVSMNEWTLPLYSRYELAGMVREEEVLRAYRFRTGEKWRDGTEKIMEVFLSVDEDGELHLHCFEDPAAAST